MRVIWNFQRCSLGDHLLIYHFYEIGSVDDIVQSIEILVDCLVVVEIGGRTIAINPKMAMIEVFEGYGTVRRNVKMLAERS